MSWFNILITTITCLVKYGPTLWELGVKVYKIVEDMKDTYKAANPRATPQATKKFADELFDERLVTAAKNSKMYVPSGTTRMQLRRDVWATRKDNYKKILEGKAEK